MKLECIYNKSHYFILQLLQMSSGSLNRQLQARYNRKESFKKQMDHTSSKYAAIEQQAYYADLSNMDKAVLTKVQNQRGEDWWMIIGECQPTGQKSLEKMLLYVVAKIPRPTRSYGLIYINTLADSSSYAEFKRILQVMPIEYFYHLLSIHVLHCSFMHKASSFLSFGTITTYLKEKTHYHDTLHDLSLSTGISCDKFIKLMPQKIIEELQKEEVEIKKVKQQVKLIYASNFAKKIEENGFGAELAQGIKKTKSEDVVRGKKQIPNPSNHPSNIPIKPPKKQISQYEIGQTGAPLILQLLIFYFRQHPQTLNSEGLFRKSVSIDDQIEILAELEMKHYEYLKKVTDPHIIANAIKRFIAGMKTPVIPYASFHYLIDRESDPQLPMIIHDEIRTLPRVNFMTLTLLFQFLVKTMLPVAKITKMNEHNLAICMGPCIMRAQIPSAQDLIYSMKIIKVAGVMITKFQQVFGDDGAINQLYRKSWKMHQKQSLKEKLLLNNEAIQVQKEKEKNENQQNKGNQSEEVPCTPQFGKNEKLLNKTTQYLSDKLLQENDSDEQANFKSNFAQYQNQNNFIISAGNKQGQIKDLGNKKQQNIQNEHKFEIKQEEHISIPSNQIKPPPKVTDSNANTNTNTNLNANTNQEHHDQSVPQESTNKYTPMATLQKPSVRFHY